MYHSFFFYYCKRNTSLIKKIVVDNSVSLKAVHLSFCFAESLQVPATDGGLAERSVPTPQRWCVCRGSSFSCNTGGEWIWNCWIIGPS